MNIRVEEARDIHILTIRNSLNTYLYIQDHYKDNDDDFRKVFTDYYLSSQGIMRREENSKPYFDYMKKCNPTEDITEIVKELKTRMKVDMLEFSFASKLLHTINTDKPIYDSKVYNYLKTDCGQDMKDIQNGKDENEKLSLIKHNWDVLIDWYENFMKTSECDKWIAWFDTTFPEGKSISKIRKIDLIIYAWN